MSAKVASFVIRMINRMRRHRDAVYLDTNAWSMLAKSSISVEPLQAWLGSNGNHLWMARFQMAELSRDTRIARPLADLLRKLPVVLLDRGQNEFHGEPWYRVKAELDEFIRLDNDLLYDEFIYQLTSGPIRQAAHKLREDAESFQAWLERALRAIPQGTPRNWTQFPKRLENWIRMKCADNGVEVNEAALANRECYVGLRLSYGVLFLRYFINNQRWRSSDYIDYLHAADMAYARVVVTERNLAECIRQVAKRREITAPEMVVLPSWLGTPSEQ